MGGEARRSARGACGAPRRTTDDPPGAARRWRRRPRLARSGAPARGVPVHVSGPPPVPGGRSGRDREVARRERQSRRSPPANGSVARRPPSVHQRRRTLALSVLGIVLLAILWFL